MTYYVSGGTRKTLLTHSPELSAVSSQTQRRQRTQRIYEIYELTQRKEHKKSELMLMRRATALV